MRILWDEPKRLANLDRHGMDFRDLPEDFFTAALILPAKLGRQMAIGRQQDRIVTVVFARLGFEAVSIVSMRPASEKERRLT